jgi:hypothetical protein
LKKKSQSLHAFQNNVKIKFLSSLAKAKTESFSPAIAAN